MHLIRSLFANVLLRMNIGTRLIMLASESLHLYMYTLEVGLDKFVVKYVGFEL